MFGINDITQRLLLRANMPTAFKVVIEKSARIVLAIPIGVVGYATYVFVKPFCSKLLTSSDVLSLIDHAAGLRRDRIFKTISSSLRALLVLKAYVK